VSGFAALIVATLRENEPSTSDEVARLLGELARAGRVVALHGLNESEVAEMIADRSGVVPPDGIVRAVQEATHGNPFFVDEVVRVLVAERRLTDAATQTGALPLPIGVRSVLLGRFERLDPGARRLLAAAALAGRALDEAVLARAAGVAPSELHDALEQGARLGFLTRPRDGRERFAFAHALVREALADEVPALERPGWHERIGTAIEVVYAHDLERHAAELAHHFAIAARPGGAVGRAVDYGLRAGRTALRQLAFEQAEHELQRTLGLLDLASGDPAGARAQILLASAEAKRGLGDLDGMDACFREAIDLGRRLDPVDFADAVIRYSAARIESFFVDRVLVALLEEALERLPATPSSLRARCLARLGATLHLDPRFGERSHALTTEAVRMARALDDSGALAWALMMRIIALLGPDTLEERLALAAEVIRLADDAGDVVASLEAQTWRVHDLLELGDIEAVDLAIVAFTRTAERVRHPVYLWHVATWKVMRALLDGRLSEVEPLLGEALAAGQRAQQQSVLLRYGEGLMLLRFEQGRMRELDGLVRMSADQAAEVESWRVALASMHLKNDRRADALAEIDGLAADGFRGLPRDANWLFAVGGLAHVLWGLGDARHAGEVYELLRGYAGRMTAVRPAVGFAGSVSHYLGELAALLRDGAAARVHFEDALREHRQLRAVAWLGRTQSDYASFLLEQGTPADVPRALALAEEAHDCAVRLGLDEVRIGVEPVLALARERARGALLAPPAPSAEHVRAFVREGEYWRVVFEGREIRVRDLTGVRQIASLLRSQDREVSVLELLDESGRRSGEAGGGAAEEGAMRRDTGETLDRRARAEYRARLAALRSEVEQAREFNDLTRAAALQAEIDAINGELAKVLGLGGRPRRTGAPIERARVSVTRTIRDAIRRLRTLDPELGRFLDESIRTGRVCSYRPPGGREVGWRVE